VWTEQPSPFAILRHLFMYTHFYEVRRILAGLEEPSGQRHSPKSLSKKYAFIYMPTLRNVISCRSRLFYYYLWDETSAIFVFLRNTFVIPCRSVLAVKPLHPAPTNYKIQTNNSRKLQVLFISNFYRIVLQRKIFIENPLRLSHKRVESPSILPHFNRNYDMSTAFFKAAQFQYCYLQTQFPDVSKKQKILKNGK
jgi:hypothetical protein